MFQERRLNTRFQTHALTHGRGNSSSAEPRRRKTREAVLRTEEKMIPDESLEMQKRQATGGVVRGRERRKIPRMSFGVLNMGK